MRTTARRLGAAALFSAALMAGATGTAHAAVENPHILEPGTEIYRDTVDVTSCAVGLRCNPPGTLNISPVVHTVTRANSTGAGATVNVICSAGSYTRVRYASDRADGWVPTSTLRRHPRTLAGVVRTHCTIFQM